MPHPALACALLKATSRHPQKFVRVYLPIGQVRFSLTCPTRNFSAYYSGGTFGCVPELSTLTRLDLELALRSNLVRQYFRSLLGWRRLCAAAEAKVKKF